MQKCIVSGKLLNKYHSLHHTNLYNNQQKKAQFLFYSLSILCLLVMMRDPAWRWASSSPWACLQWDMMPSPGSAGAILRLLHEVLLSIRRAKWWKCRSRRRQWWSNRRYGRCLASSLRCDSEMLQNASQTTPKKARFSKTSDKLYMYVCMAINLSSVQRL